MVFYFTLENAGGGRPHPKRERGSRKGQNKADMVTSKTGKMEEEEEGGGHTSGLSDSYDNFI